MEKPKKSLIEQRDELARINQLEIEKYNPIWKKIQNALTRIKTDKEKIKYLEEQKTKYLQNLDAQTQASSAVTIMITQTQGELYLDRLITLELKKLGKKTKVDKYKPKYLTLDDAFIEKEKYKSFISNLVNIGVCDDSNHFATTKHMTDKGFFIEIIKQLIQGNFIHKLTQDEIRIIIHNSFNVSVSKSYIKQFKGFHINEPLFKF